MTDTPQQGVEETPAAPQRNAAGEPTGTRQPQEATNLLTLGAPPATLHEAQDKGSTDAGKRVQELSAQLAEAKAEVAAEAGDEMVMVRVEEPHSELHYGGVVLTNDFAPVPRRMLGALTTAAGDSNATITTQESES